MTSVEYYKERAKARKIPDHMHNGLAEYIVYGYHPGHFLGGIILGDLIHASKHCDIPNQKALYDYMVFLFNEAPAACWGDEIRMENWIKKGGLSRWREKGKSSPDTSTKA